MHAQELDQFYALLDEAVQKFFGCGIISAKSHYLVPCLALDEKLVLTIKRDMRRDFAAKAFAERVSDPINRFKMQ